MSQIRIALVGVGIFFLLLGFCFLAPKTYAESFSNISDIISTSRPSSATPLSVDVASGVSQVAVFDNKSLFLASDSARFVKAGVWSDPVTIASQSADRTQVSFVGETTAGHNKTEILVVPVTAKHTISFITKTTVPVGGKIQIIFNTGDTSNSASPSARGWSFNGLGNSNISLYAGGATCNGGWVVTPTSGLLACTIATSAINPKTVITVTVGINTSVIINPTKSATIDTADTWTLQIKTLDGSSNTLDSGKTRIGTIETVQVQVAVAPFLSVVIAGMTNETDFNGTNGCPASSEKTNSGIASTATTVDLGALRISSINLAGQTIKVSTNTSYGYAITATSSGKFIDANTGYWIKGASIDGSGNDVALSANDTPSPAVFPSLPTERFGISPCGTRVGTQWLPGATVTSLGAKLSNPWNSGTNSYYATIATYIGGPISDDTTAIRYAATITAITPAGNYRTVFTYMVTPTF